MRVTFSEMHRDAAAGIEKAAERLLQYQRQVATGKRIERSSDDPSSTATIILERTAQATMDRYSRSGDSARAALTVADTVLSDLVEQFTAAQVAVLSARGSTKTPAQRDAAAEELLALRDGMLRNLNTSYRGTYIFGGAAGTTPPYVKNGTGTVSAYQGAAREVSLDVSREQAVTVAFDGEALAKGAAPDDLFVVMESAIAAARAGDEAGMTAAMDDLARAFERATTLQGRIGAALRTVEEEQLQHAASSRASGARVVAVEEVSMAAAITGMTQAETAYRAALGAAGQMTRLSLMDYLK
jgi:flagellar hook-associated protein 3 FlgL